MEEIHVLDKDGDMIIVLRNSGNSSFVTWGHKMKEEARETRDAEHAVERERGFQNSIENTTSHMNQHDEDDEKEIFHRYRVSSEKLCLASPIFRVIIKGPWADCQGGTDDEPREVNIAGFLHADFLIFLTIIQQGRWIDIPWEGSREQIHARLFDVAIIADYYQCHGDPFRGADGAPWGFPSSEELLGGKSPQDDDHIARSLFLCFAFGWETEFFDLTSNIVVLASGPLHTTDKVDFLDAEFLEILEEKRRGAIRAASRVINRHLEYLQARINEDADSSCNESQKPSHQEMELREIRSLLKKGGILLRGDNAISYASGVCARQIEACLRDTGTPLRTISLWGSRIDPPHTLAMFHVRLPARCGFGIERYKRYQARSSYEERLRVIGLERG